MPDVDFDAVVVGAGPAGSCAATVLARAGKSVLLLERGPFAGSKNMYGGVASPSELYFVFFAMPMTSSHGPVGLSMLRRLPIAFAFGQYRAAMASLITTTPGVSERSALVNSRPRSSGMPSVSK